MSFHIRAASAHDAQVAAPLIYSSGPKAFEFIFSNDQPLACVDFLQDAFKGSKGLFSYRHHYVVESENKVVAVIGHFTQASMASTQVFTALHILKYLGLFNGLRSMLRGLIFENKLVKAPLKNCFYIAHVGVSADFRGQGIGERMIAFVQAKAEIQGFKKLALDVSVTNPRAQSLYERLNFKVMKETPSYRPELDHHRYMEACL